jgi:transglutaminase-like putative cysteine protease
VLTLQTNPPVVLRLERDGADNLFATVVGASRGSVRAVYLMDAPRSYFGRAIPDAPVDVRADRVRPLPASAQRDAEEFLATLGLSRRSTFRQALRALTRHFRSFEESPDPPRDTGNIFLDLARGMKGICRHRAYGFVVAAQAIGMHARFVQNEAHAWVEVELPGDAGWLRVDLGGAALGLEAHGAENRPTYRPEVGDTLPRPAAYERAYEQARRMSGLRREGGEPGDPTEPGAEGVDGAPGGAGGGRPGSGGEGNSAGSPDPSRNEPSGTRAPLELSVDSPSFEVFRGHELVVTGAARGRGRGVAGLRVEALLRAPRGEAEWLLGVTVTGEQGRYRGVFGVPPDLAVGDYRLVVRTPGNREWAPAQAR